MSVAARESSAIVDGIAVRRAVACEQGGQPVNGRKLQEKGKERKGQESAPNETEPGRGTGIKKAEETLYTPMRGCANRLGYEIKRVRRKIQRQGVLAAVQPSLVKGLQRKSAPWLDKLTFCKLRAARA